jgi:hypothetical protein
VGLAKVKFAMVPILGIDKAPYDNTLLSQLLDQLQCQLRHLYQQAARLAGFTDNSSRSLPHQHQQQQ